MKSKVNKNQWIEEGRSQLARHEFPLNLLSKIKEKRLRKEVLRSIMDDGLHFSTMTKGQKEYRAKRLKLELAAADYLDGRDRLFPTLYALFILGIITFITAFLGLNDNLFFGISMVFQAVTFLVIAYSNGDLNKTLGLFSLVLGVMIPLEILVFGLPDQFIPTTIFNRGTSYKVRGIIPFLIEQTPYIFILLRLSFWLSIFQFYRSYRKFEQVEQRFKSEI